MKYKIFYVDGTVSTDKEPLKNTGVAVIIQQNDRVGRRVLQYHDWYRLIAGYWFECNQFDILLELTKSTTVTALRGQYIPEDQYEQILIKAHNDQYLPPISPALPAHEAWQGRTP